VVKRLTIIAVLKEGTGQRAAELLAAGPPLALEQTHFVRHAVVLGRDAVAFLFEGPDVEWELDELTSDAFHPALRAALGAWEEIIDGKPIIAKEVFFWERAADPGVEGLGQT
jgi:hypothetical protein